MSAPDRARRRYRRLLAILPGDVRARFGRDMEELFLDRLSSAGHGRFGAWSVWVHAVLDVCTHAVTMRLPRRLEEGGGGMGSMGQDLRYALRALTAGPLLAAAAIVTLGLGIGASTATFSVVHAVLLEKLPFEEPERLVFVWPEVNANKAMVLRAEERMSSLSAVSGMSSWTLTLTGAGDPAELTGLVVSPNYFDLLGVTPALGRGFRAGDDLPGAAGIVILSHDVWVRAFGSDPDVIDRVIELGGADYDARRIVGVMPPGVEEFWVWAEPDVWIPLEGDPARGLAEDDSWYVNHRIARLAPAATLQRANQDVIDYAVDVQREMPSTFGEEDAAGATVQPVRDFLTRDVRTAIWVALGAVGLVLLIGCFNVANLLLARGEARVRDLAVRSALGAGRARLTRMLLGEAALLGVAGGLVGIVVAFGSVDLLTRWAPDDLPGMAEVSVDPSVLLFGILATLASTLIAGLLPAVRVGRVEATASLGGGARGSAARGPGRITPVLVGGQVALAVVVAVGSGLMLRSLTTLLAVDPGLDGAGVVAFKPNPPAGRYPDGAAFQEFYRQVTERVAALPGIRSVGGINLLPGTSGTWSFPTFPEGYVQDDGVPTPSVNFRAVRGDYFATTGISLMLGRAVGDSDRSDTEPVVTVNESFVNDFWPGQDPIGRTLSIFSTDGTRYRVVGVVADIRQHGRDAQPRAEMYFSHAQVPWDQMSMWIMADVGTDDPMSLASTLREAVWEVDPDVPVTGLAHLEDVLHESTRTTRFLTLLLASFGGLALFLSAVGVFGVTAYSTGRRMPEFGVRLALGSSRRSVLRTAVVTSLRPAVAGLVVGLLAASASSRLLQSVLFQIEPSDPATFVGTALVLTATALLAAAVPAWRASRVDPVRVLGSD